MVYKNFINRKLFGRSVRYDQTQSCNYNLYLSVRRTNGE